MEPSRGSRRRRERRRQARAEQGAKSGALDDDPLRLTLAGVPTEEAEEEEVSASSRDREGCNQALWVLPPCFDATKRIPASTRAPWSDGGTPRR